MHLVLHDGFHMLVCVNYHYIRPSFPELEGIRGITPTQLRSQLEQLSGIGRFVSEDDVVRMVEAEKLDDLDDLQFFITLDDGLQEQWDHARPIFDAMGVSPVYYVSTRPLAERRLCDVHRIHHVRSLHVPADILGVVQSFAKDAGVDVEDVSVERATHQYRYDSPQTAQLKYLLNFQLPRDSRAAVAEALARVFIGDATAEAEVVDRLYMSAENVRSLAQAGQLGSHAHAHAALGLLQRDDAHDDVAQSLTRLQHIGGVPMRSISYPYGSVEAAPSWMADILEELGLSFGVTTVRGANVDLRQPSHLRRFDNNDVPGGKACAETPAEFVARLRAEASASSLVGDL